MLLNTLIAIDQFFNALFAGNPRETISSRCGKQVNSCVLCWFLCRILDCFDRNHCQKSLEYPINHREMLGSSNNGYFQGLYIAIKQIFIALKGGNPDLP